MGQHDCAYVEWRLSVARRVGSVHRKVQNAPTDYDCLEDASAMCAAPPKYKTS